MVGINKKKLDSTLSPPLYRCACFVHWQMEIGRCRCHVDMIKRRKSRCCCFFVYTYRLLISFVVAAAVRDRLVWQCGLFTVRAEADSPAATGTNTKIGFSLILFFEASGRGNERTNEKMGHGSPNFDFLFHCTVTSNRPRCRALLCDLINIHLSHRPTLRYKRAA